MNILDIPFHKYLDLKKSTDPSYIFCTDQRPEYLNHLGNVHACVQLSLAEASSGEFLLMQLFELRSVLVPVIRKTEAKYHKPGNGSLRSKAYFENANREEILAEIMAKGRVLIKVKTEIYDDNNVKSLTAVFEWFIVKQSV